MKQKNSSASGRKTNSKLKRKRRLAREAAKTKKYVYNSTDEEKEKSPNSRTNRKRRKKEGKSDKKLQVEKNLEKKVSPEKPAEEQQEKNAVEPKRAPVFVKTPKQEVIPPNQQQQHEQFSDGENPQTDPDEVVEYVVEDFSIICADSFEKLEDPQVTRTVFDMSSYDEGEVSDVGPCDEEGENEKVQNSPETQSSGIPLEESCTSSVSTRSACGYEGEIESDSEELSKTNKKVKPLTSVAKTTKSQSGDQFFVPAPRDHRLKPQHYNNSDSDVILCPTPPPTSLHNNQAVAMRRRKLQNSKVNMIQLTKQPVANQQQAAGCSSSSLNQPEGLKRHVKPQMTVIPQKQENRRRDQLNHQLAARQHELHRRSHARALTGLPGHHAGMASGSQLHNLSASQLSAHNLSAAHQAGLSGHPLSGLHALNPHHQSLLEQHHQSMLQLELNSRFLREQQQLHSYLANPHMSYLNRLLPNPPSIPHQNSPFTQGASPYFGAFHPKLHPTTGNSPYNFSSHNKLPSNRLPTAQQLKIPQSDNRNKVPLHFPPPKPRGRRCALHVKIAFMIQNHQKKAKKEKKRE